MSRVTFKEYAVSRPSRVDHTEGVIYDVRVCGQNSRNGRRYPESVLRAAAPLYEQCKVGSNHPDELGSPRSWADSLGWLEGIYLKDGALWARKLHVLKQHPYAALLLEMADKAGGRLIALSHNASGTGNEDGTIIESIDQVHSVDVVSDGATNKTLFENTMYNPTSGQDTDDEYGTPGASGGEGGKTSHGSDLAGQIRELLRQALDNADGAGEDVYDQGYLRWLEDGLNWCAEMAGEDAEDEDLDDDQDGNGDAYAGEDQGLAQESRRRRGRQSGETWLEGMFRRAKEKELREEAARRRRRAGTPSAPALRPPRRGDQPVNVQEWLASLEKRARDQAARATAAAKRALQERKRRKR
jgi:hypothetical protein